MRKLRTTILAGAAALIAIGAAGAATAETRHMNVTLPDGSVAHIEYTGEVAPRVTVAPASARTTPFAFDPFAGFERIAAMMEAQRQAMMRHMAALEKAVSRAVEAGPEPFTLVGSPPAGAHYTYVSMTTDANGCTRSVEYRSDGSGAAPKVTRTSAGDCDSSPGGFRPIIEVSATADTAAPVGHQV